MELLSRHIPWYPMNEVIKQIRKQMELLNFFKELADKVKSLVVKEVKKEVVKKAAPKKAVVKKPVKKK